MSRKSLELLLTEFRRAKVGASAESLRRVGEQLGVEFPDDYVELMQQSNGGERRKRTKEVVLMPFIGDPEDALVGGASLAEFLEAYGSGMIWKRRR